MQIPPHKNLRHRLTQLRETIEHRQQQRRQQRMEKLKVSRTQETDPLAGHRLSQFVPHPESQAVFEKLMTYVHHDRRRLSKDPLEHTEALAPSGELTAPATYLWLAENWNQGHPLLPAAPAPTEEQRAAGVNPCVQAFLQAELDFLINNQNTRAHVSAPLLQKLKQATQAYSEGRSTDAVTLIKNALTGDPHNQTLLACLSQILYGLAVGGVATALPEARDSAQRSTIAGERQRPPRLMLYRYLAAITERNFSEDRAMAWLRDGELLNTVPLISHRQGMMAEQGLYLRAWALASTINPAHWTEHDFRALRHLVHEVVGGGAVYLMWLRTPLLQFASTSKAVPAELEDIESLMNRTYDEYLLLQQGSSKLPIRTSPMPWILRVRWLNTLQAIMPFPAFETMLAHISLSGDNWRDNVFPDRELRSQLMENSLNMWQIWAQSVTPFKDMRKPYLLPIEDTVLDADLLEQVDQLLPLLKAAEQERIDAALWPDLKQWLVRWQPDHLLAAATGSSQPRNRYSPSLMPYSTFYRSWQEPQISGLLASELIEETARRGGFASMFEVIAAFEGALRLLDDPTHGLEATQRRALAEARKQFPEKFASVKPTFNSSASLKMGMAILPLGVFGAWIGAMALADNVSQMIGFSLALLGLAGVVMLNLTKN